MRQRLFIGALFGAFLAVMSAAVPAHAQLKFAYVDVQRALNECDAGKVARVTTAGVVTEFAIPTAGSEPEAITTGPDGNLWFTQAAGNRIARITPAGVVTDVGAASVPPFGLCTSMANPQVAAATAAAQNVLTPQPCQPVLSPWSPGATVTSWPSNRARRQYL